jgi:ABC-type sulfate transport system permease component
MIRAARLLGATRAEVIAQVVVPAALDRGRPAGGGGDRRC